MELEKSEKKAKKVSPRRGGRRGRRQIISNEDDSDVSYESDHGNNVNSNSMALQTNNQRITPSFVCLECQQPSFFYFYKRDWNFSNIRSFR